MSSVEQIFRCRECGFCCHGETTVSLDDDDIRRLVDFLKMPLAEINKRYLRQSGKVTQMKIVDGHCIFYDEGCTIHPGKPWRCRQWPLHPAILKDENNFRTIRESCPGISKIITYADFCRIMADLPEDDY
ncbi:MAG: YkgJ family cysteine cluster protein [Deltaproteobacteria bacterium]|nr:YkgJ family cysteine cluster protein [Deltaproteobacteria bacterium]